MHRDREKQRNILKQRINDSYSSFSSILETKTRSSKAEELTTNIDDYLKDKHWYDEEFQLILTIEILTYSIDVNDENIKNTRRKNDHLKTITKSSCLENIGRPVQDLFVSSS